MVVYYVGLRHVYMQSEFWHSQISFGIPFRASASRAPPRGDGGQRSMPVIRQSPWITACMADARKCITMQRNLGASVSAAGQGEKTGPQASSSSDRSSTLVGDLAAVESNVTRKQRTGILPEHTCESEHNVFCRSKFEVSSLRKVIDDRIREIYKDIFGFNMDESGRWAPNIICNSCRKIFDRWSQNQNRQSLKFSRPAIWSRPSSIEDCFYCCNIIRGYSNKNKSKIVYQCFVCHSFSIHINR